MHMHPKQQEAMLPIKPWPTLAFNIASSGLSRILQPDSRWQPINLSWIDSENDSATFDRHSKDSVIKLAFTWIVYTRDEFVREPKKSHVALYQHFQLRLLARRGPRRGESDRISAMCACQWCIMSCVDWGVSVDVYGDLSALHLVSFECGRIPSSM